MKVISDKRRAENVERRQTMIAVRERDGNACVGGFWTNPETGDPYLPEPCFGALNGHEIITRADGGSITDAANIVLLCTQHNRWCDLHHDEALTRGFRQSRFDPFSSNVAIRLPHVDSWADDHLSRLGLPRSAGYTPDAVPDTSRLGSFDN